MFDRRCCGLCADVLCEHLLTLGLRSALSSSVVTNDQAQSLRQTGGLPRAEYESVDRREGNLGAVFRSLSGNGARLWYYFWSCVMKYTCKGGYRVGRRLFCRTVDFPRGDALKSLQTF